MAAVPMEQIPVEVMTKILEFSTLPERLQLARCNTTLLHVITRGCRALWVEIDLHEELASNAWYDPVNVNRPHLSDAMLSALLTRVNAREVTRYLNLRDCRNIEGSGLEPLRFSRVLERLELDTRHEPRLQEEATMIEILSTMIPHRLWDVRFDPLQVKRTTIKGFLTNLRAGKRQQAIEDRVKCHNCSLPVAEEKEKERKCSERCSHCHNYFCRKSSCSVTVQDCSDCKNASSCDDCNFVRHCDDCDKCFCCACQYVSFKPCRVCNKSFCGPCVFSIICDDCETCICDRCSESYLYCDWCDMNHFCSTGDCRKIELCNSCDMPCCFVCSNGGLKVCTVCSQGFCKSDDPCGFVCDCCQENFCSECSELAQCDSCKKNFCNSCASDDEDHILTMTQCSACGKSFCAQCRDDQGPCNMIDSSQGLDEEEETVENNADGGKASMWFCSIACSPVVEALKEPASRRQKRKREDAA